MQILCKLFFASQINKFWNTSFWKTCHLFIHANKIQKNYRTCIFEKPAKASKLERSKELRNIWKSRLENEHLQKTTRELDRASIVTFSTQFSNLQNTMSSISRHDLNIKFWNIPYKSSQSTRLKYKSTKSNIASLKRYWQPRSRRILATDSTYIIIYTFYSTYCTFYSGYKKLNKNRSHHTKIENVQISIHNFTGNVACLNAVFLLAKGNHLDVWWWRHLGHMTRGQMHW